MLFFALRKQDAYNGFAKPFWEGIGAGKVPADWRKY